MAWKYCETCKQPMRSDSEQQQCRACLSVCHCGNRKDHRAIECISCANSRAAKKQWANPDQRQRILEGIQRAGIERRTRLEDVGQLIWQERSDGRFWNWYWPEGVDRKSTVYRYQWAWIMANGPIPEGHVIHHVNHDPADDRLENLQLLSIHEHCKLHGKIASSKSTKPWWTCQTCGEHFRSYRREGEDRKYCSVACHYEARRTKVAAIANQSQTGDLRGGRDGRANLQQQPSQSTMA